MVQCGVLGNITYIDSEHGWAVNAGEILGSLCIASLSTDSGAEILNTEELRTGLSRLQHILNAKGIGWTAPATYDQGALDQIFNAVGLQIRNCSSPIHCACFYLGLAQVLMQGWIVLASTHPTVAEIIGKVVRSKLDDIGGVCAGV